MAQPTRCSWAGPEPIYLDYHDHEWGRPTHDDRALFELLSLEGREQHSLCARGGHALGNGLRHRLRIARTAPVNNSSFHIRMFLSMMI